MYDPLLTVRAASGSLSPMSRSNPLQYALEAVAQSKSLPCIDMRLFWNRDETTGEDTICAVVTEREYFALEKEAQRQGKTIVEIIYPQIIDALQEHGYNTPTQCFFVSVEPPRDGEPPCSCSYCPPIQ